MCVPQLDCTIFNRELMKNVYKITSSLQIIKILPKEKQFLWKCFITLFTHHLSESKEKFQIH